MAEWVSLAEQLLTVRPVAARAFAMQLRHDAALVGVYLTTLVPVSVDVKEIAADGPT